MPLTPEEPQIYESVPGPRNAAGAARTPQAPRTAAPIPGPRPAPRPAPPRADSKGPSTPGRPGASGKGGPPTPNTPGASAAAQIQLVAATEATAVEVADEAVDKLLDEGRAPNDILLITTGEQHPLAQHELSFGEDAYWRQLADGEDVFCAHASDIARTTGRGIVLLVVNGGADPEVSAALPAALEKATEQLVVCGDPARLSALL